MCNLFKKNQRRIVVSMLLAVMLLVCTAFVQGPSEVSAASNAKAKKTYKKFLAKNESKYTVEEGDWNSKNTEGYKKTSSFLVVDMDKDGMVELVCCHPTGYKQANLYVYKYKGGKVKKVGSINIDSNAAGGYTVYSCKKKHLHVNWFDSMIGYTDVTYTISKKGKLKKYMEASEDKMANTVQFKKNGKKITADQYSGVVSKCISKDYLQENTATNRNKM